MNTKLNKSDFYLLTIYFVISFIIQGINYYERGALLREYLIDFPVELVILTTTIYLFVFLLIPEFLLKKRYILFILFGISTFVILSGIDYIIGFLTGNNNWDKFPTGLDFILQTIDKGSEETAFPFALLLTKKFYEGQTEYFKIEKQQKENELKLLRSQLDPHFLFNNLNTLDALIDSDSAKAKEYINRLSLIYRYLIQTKDSEVMELSEELKLAENYIFLIKTRFGDDYEFSIESTAEIQDRFIPTGAIQTLLENVVKHNKVLNGNTIKTAIEIDELKLTVTNTKSNNGQNNESFGTGLKNLKSRYKLLSDKQVIILNTDDKFTVKIPILNLET